MSALNRRPLNCLVIDDEHAAHQVLKFHIEKTPFLKYCGSFYDAVNALINIPEIAPDIIFLDVNMPDLTGFQLLDILSLKQFNVILTTAHEQYAIDGYQYDNITSFLLKPITFEKFLKAVNKVRKFFHDGDLHACLIANPIKEEIAVRPVLMETKELFLPHDIHEGQYPYFSEDSMWIKVEKKMYRLEYGDILFIEAQKNYVKVHATNHQLVTRTSLGELEKNLPAGRFVRTHRSYIVNRGAVKTIEGNTITMNNDFRVSISSPERLSVFRSLFQ